MYYRTLHRLVKCEAVLGIPKLSSLGKIVCGDCHKGKQIKTSHTPIPIVYDGVQTGILNVFSSYTWI